MYIFHRRILTCPPPIPSTFSQNVKSFILALLDKSPATRLGSTGAIPVKNHVFFKVSSYLQRKRVAYVHDVFISMGAQLKSVMICHHVNTRPHRWTLYSISCPVGIADTTKCPNIFHGLSCASMIFYSPQSISV